jgi:hypothetical protein
VDEIPEKLIQARNVADLAADAQLAVWDSLPAVPSFEQIIAWMEARDKFHAAQSNFIMCLWEFHSE